MTPEDNLVWCGKTLQYGFLVNLIEFAINFLTFFTSDYSVTSFCLTINYRDLPI